MSDVSVLTLLDLSWIVRRVHPEPRRLGVDWDTTLPYVGQYVSRHAVYQEVMDETQSICYVS